MSRPRVIDDQEHERVCEHVAAIEVARKAGMVCARLPHPSGPGARQWLVGEVPATLNAVRELAAAG
jgi:hypothetical protein